MSESIGAIKVPGMILTATVLTLGSLALCVSLHLWSGLLPKSSTPLSLSQPSNTLSPSSSEWAWCIRSSSTSWSCFSSSGGLTVFQSPRAPTRWCFLEQSDLLHMGSSWPASIASASTSSWHRLPPSSPLLASVLQSTSLWVTWEKIENKELL